MQASDVSIHKPAELRRVGIRYPDHLRVMRDAIRVLRDLGIDLDVEGDQISVLVPEPVALYTMGMLERYTGVVGFNEWEAGR